MSKGEEASATEPDWSLQEGLRISAELRALAVDLLRLTLVEALQRRAAEARPGVAEHLLRRANVHLQALQGGVGTGAEVEAPPRRPDRASGWQQLVQEMQSQQPQVGEESAIERQCREQEQVLFESLGIASADEPTAEDSGSGDTPLPELKAAGKLRSVKARRQSQQRVSRALSAQPESPGPLNPQMLAIKALSQMQALSPQYLERFVSYLDTLMLLAQQEPEKAANKPGRKPARAPRKSSRKK